MLFKKGGYWADTDLICVKKINLSGPYVFSSEPDKNYEKSRINAGLIKLPKNSEVANEGIEIIKKCKNSIVSGQIKWSSGPETVKKLVEKYNLEKYVLNWEGISSCYWEDYESIINVKCKRNKLIINCMRDIPDTMYAIHLWNEVWRRNKLNKDGKYPDDCLYEELKKTHLN